MNSVLALIALCFTCATCYPDGAPLPACDKLTPIHLNQTAQTSPSPYGIQIDAAEWATSGVMTVTLTGTPVRGFLLQARKTSNGEGLGMFDSTKLPAGAQTGPCLLKGPTPTFISVTHTNPDTKGKLMFNWKLSESESYDGQVYFQGAVAQSHDIFWVNITSKDFSIDSDKLVVATSEQPPSHPSTHEDTTASNMTTSEMTTSDMTTSNMTTSEMTTSNMTTSEMTTSDMTTSEMTTSNMTTSEMTTSNMTTSEMTTSDMTTSNMTTSEMTTSDMTTSEMTTSNMTTSEMTTSNMTTNEMTTSDMTVSDTMTTHIDKTTTGGGYASAASASLLMVTLALWL